MSKNTSDFWKNEQKQFDVLYGNTQWTKNDAEVDQLKDDYLKINNPEGGDNEEAETPVAELPHRLLMTGTDSELGIYLHKVREL